MRFGVRLLSLIRLGEGLFGIRLELRLGNGLDFGAPFPEVVSKEGESDDSADEN